MQLTLATTIDVAALEQRVGRGVRSRSISSFRLESFSM
jgi:hypothetical protein